MTFTIVPAALNNPAHANAVLTLLNEFAADDFGRRQAMSAEEQERLLPGLRAFDNKLLLLANCADVYAGIAVCYFEFSIFSGRKMLRLHDLYVTPPYRGRKIARQLVAAVVEKARHFDCAFLTVEVEQENQPAIALYRSFGCVDWIAPTQYLELKLD